MSQDNLVRMQCTKCKRFNYWTRKNIKRVERKLEYSKFCKWCRTRTKHKQAKKT